MAFDSGYRPDSGFLLRRQAAIGDLDGDGQDDAVVWGNAGEAVEQQGQRPVIRIYFGRPGRLEPQPDIDTRFDPGRPWYEVLDVAVEPGGLAFLTAEDLAERDSPPPHVRRVRSGVIEVAGEYIGAPVFRSQQDIVTPGYVDAPAPSFVLARDRAIGGETRLVYGLSGWEGMWLPTLGSEEQLTEPGGTFLFWEEEMPAMQDAFTVDNDEGGEDMVVVTRTHAGRTAGDASAGQTIFESDMNGDCARVVRADAEYGQFQAFASCEGEPQMTLIGAYNASMAPTLFRYDIEGSGSPTDFEFMDVGGDPLSADLVILSDGALVVYGDLQIGPPVEAVWQASQPIEGDYDLLVVGHFHGAATHQIYLLSTRQPDLEPICYGVSGVFTVEPCP